MTVGRVGFWQVEWMASFLVALDGFRSTSDVGYFTFERVGTWDGRPEKSRKKKFRLQSLDRPDRRISYKFPLRC